MPKEVDVMLLGLYSTPRYEVGDPTPITLDSVVEGTVVNVSETGLTIATPFEPVLNSVVRISVQLPGNEMPCDTRAQVVWSASSGQIGLVLPEPDSFRGHFETWRRFSTQKKSTACTAAQPQADVVAATSGEAARPQADTAIDAEPSKLPIFSRTVNIAGAIACALLAGTMWLWYGRTHKADANVQASGSPSAEPAAAAIPAPVNLIQRTSEPAPRPSTADAATLPSTLDVARSDASTKSAVAPKRTEHQGTSHAQIVVNLNRFSRVNPKLLHKPERIYFDLSPGTRPKVSTSSVSRAGNRLVRGIRIGHAENGLTRVVLDLQRPCEYHAKVSSTPPYQLIIDVRAQRGKG